MMTATLSRIKLLSHAAEQLIGPLLVFVISYTHHVYFADDFVSSFFAAFSLVSLLLVMAIDKPGLMVAMGIQLAFLGWVALADPLDFKEQLLFSASVSISLFASYLNNSAPAQEYIQEPAQEAKSPTIIEQKEKLWQELFDARQEIKTLYEQKQALESAVESKVAAVVHEKDEKILFLQHHLEASLIEKQQFIEDKAECEEDLKKFGSHMHEMALYQETLRQEILRLEELRAKEQKKKIAAPEAQVEETEDKPSHYEAMYRQLKQQFEEKSTILDNTRKELFIAQNELATLQKAEQENLEPTAEEKHLMQELVALQDKLDALKRTQEEELVGYEEVIQGLLNQLHDKSSN